MAFLECVATNENRRYEFFITTFMRNGVYPFFVFWNDNLTFNNLVDLAAEVYLRRRSLLEN